MTEQHETRTERPIEQRLRDALQARADLVEDPRVAPDLATVTPIARWRAPLAAAVATIAVAASVTVAVMLGTGDDGEVQPAPAPTTPSDSAGLRLADPDVTGDLDGDGIEDTVALEGPFLVAALSSTEEPVTARVGAGATLGGLADVGSDRAVVMVDYALYRIGPAGSFQDVVLEGWTSDLMFLSDAGHLLTGTQHGVGRQEYITTYRWTGGGRTLTPTADALYCGTDPGDGSVLEVCGTDDTFVGEIGTLPELQPLSWDSVAPGGGETAVSQPGFGDVIARLEGEVEEGTEIGAGQVDLVVGEARLALEAGAGPSLLNASLRSDTGDLVVMVIRAIGDSHSYDLYRYDGASITPVEVVATDGLTLAGGGPALGGPYTEVFLGQSGGIFSLRAESGIDLYQRAVQWVWDGGRLVGEPLGVVCLDSLVHALDVPGAYGDCGLPER